MPGSAIPCPPERHTHPRGSCRTSADTARLSCGTSADCSVPVSGAARPNLTKSRRQGRRGCAAISSLPANPARHTPPGESITVAVIGSASLNPPDPRCELARHIGSVIGERGWTLLTGGYGGLMAMASQAAAEAGGIVIGLPMRRWHNLTPNRWNHELRWSDTYPERLGHLLAASAVVVLDGGIGTLSEAATVWAALQTQDDTADLIFAGPAWKPVLRAFATHLVIEEHDLARVTLCPDAEMVAAHIASSRSKSRPPAQPRG